MKKPIDQTLSEALQESRAITPEALSQAQAESRTSRERLDATLLRLKLLSRQQLADCLAARFRVPFVNIKEIRLNPETLKVLPESCVRNYQVLPLELRQAENSLTVAMADPGDSNALEYVRIITGFEPKPCVALPSQLEEVIRNTYAQDPTLNVLKELALQLPKNTPENHSENGESTEGPVVKLMDSILEHAVNKHASDVHLEPQREALLVRLRIDGLLHTIHLLPKEVQNQITARVKIMAGMDVTERRLPQDGQFSQELHHRLVDFRVSSLPAKYGEKIVLRVLDKQGFLMDFKHLGLLAEHQIQLESLLEQPSGIILVTGPTGSGKSTTLYAMINRIRSSFKNILTLEDPVEYELLADKGKEGGITQVQMNSRIDLTFARALRSCLRQDPDVILIGEIRDKETVEVAISAALTGHLVLSSLHTNGAIESVVRLLDMGLEPYLIVSSLSAVVAQRLVRVLCQHCKEPYAPPAKLIRDMGIPKMDGQDVTTLYRAKGCEDCGGTGYRSRMGVYELLNMDPTIKDLILRRGSPEEIKKQAKLKNFSTLQENGLKLVAQGHTTLAEILRVA